MARTTTSTRPADQPTVARLDVVNTASGEKVGDVEVMDAERVAELATRARAAQPAWEAMGVEGRCDVVDRFRRRLVRNKEMVIETMQAETGKSWEDCNGDLLVLVAWAQQFAALAPEWLADEHPPGMGVFSIRRENTITRTPLGLVGVIAPWNVPLTLGIGDALPALLAGNAVVVKPSEHTPLSSQLVAKLFVEAGAPLHVLAIATGAGETGAALVDEVDYIHFTGSVETGRRVAQRAAERLIGCSLELGGNDAMIVLADADLERASSAAVHYAMFNTGQVCMSTERVYVEDRVHDRFVELVTAKVLQLHQGVPQGPGTVDVSSFIAPAQLDIVTEHVADAVARGARVAAGGRTTIGPGTFHQPTVLIDVDHSMRCMQEETFGPTMPIMRVRDAEQAVALANDSQFGLTASVWTSDVERGVQIARRIEAGTVTVNDAMFHLGDVTLPMGGWKQSGLGHRNGRAGMTRFTRQKVIQVAHTLGSREPTWMPYDARTTVIMNTVYDAIFGSPRLPKLPTPRGVVRSIRSLLG